MTGRKRVVTTTLHDFAHRYLTTRAVKLAALADAAAARGDQELADRFRVELERKTDALSPPHLRVVVDPGSTTSS